MKNIMKLASLTSAAAILCLASCQTTSPTTSKKPKVTITNIADRDVGIKLSGPEDKLVILSVKASKTFRIKPGVYQYALVGKETTPLTGTKTFEKNRIYQWNFNRFDRN